MWAVTKADEARLDRYEGYPAFYYKTELDITYKGLVRHETDTRNQKTAGTDADCHDRHAD